MEKQKAFRIYGKVRELESMIGDPGLKIEAFDEDLIFDDRLGSVTTDIDGNFEIRYERDLSEKIAEILNGKVEIEEDDAYTFVPFVYEKPVFAPEIFAGPVRRVRKTELPPWCWKGLPAPEILQHLEKYRVTEKPTPEPAIASATALKASESASMRIVTPIDGIPAPELLYALDTLRF